jgi:hypothetical protein
VGSDIPRRSFQSPRAARASQLRARCSRIRGPLQGERRLLDRPRRTSSQIIVRNASHNAGLPRRGGGRLPAFCGQAYGPSA